MTPYHALPPEAKRTVVGALREVGYAQSLLGERIEFNVTGESSRYLDPVPLAAFWDTPFDQHTSAIAVRWLPSEEAPAEYVRALGKHLWAPFSIIARPDQCELWDTLPQNGNGRLGPSLLQTVPYEHLSRTLKGYESDLGLIPVRGRKERCRQMALYEVSEAPDAFLDWAFRPTLSELVRLLTRILRDLIPEQSPFPEKVFRLHWVMRFLGVRIAGDKEWLDIGSRTSAEDLVSAAELYPAPVQQTAHGSHSQIRDIAEEFISAVASVNLQIADGGLLSHLIQTHGLPDDIRRAWKLYPTPSDLAWRMVETLPVEVVPADSRVIWDGMCGTGTLLVAGMERLRKLPDSFGDAARMKDHLMGNDREPLLADITRLALDTARGGYQEPPWSVETRDVRRFTLDSFARRPTIIVGNPPFEGRGPRADLAIEVINKYIDILKPGGMLAVVMPRSLLGSSGSQATQLRERLIRGFELYELWELPQGFAKNTSAEAAIVCARKRYEFEEQRSAVLWRLFDAKRHTEPLGGVIPSPDVWLRSPGKTFDPPGMVRLRAMFADYPPLAAIIGSNRIKQGITLGKEGLSEVVDHHEPGTRKYIGGRTGMAPFYLPWRERSRWIRYDSTKLERPRRRDEPLFQQRKVLVSRISTGGNPWVGMAAVDEENLYPSSDFIYIVPEPAVSCEMIAGLFNSALVNFWLRSGNPGRGARVNEYATLPVPFDKVTTRGEVIVGLARELANLQELAPGHERDSAVHNELEAKTLALDDAVYDLYEVPIEVRREISSYFKRHSKARPGFRTSNVAGIGDEAVELIAPMKPDTMERFRQLLQASKLRELNETETSDLDALLAQWEEAQILANKAMFLDKGTFQRP